MTAPAHTDKPARALFEHLTDFGWVRLEDRGVKHWGEDNRLLCGLKPGPELRDVLGQDALSWNEHIGACKKCVSELVRRKFDLPFRVGQRVISRAHGMTLRGKIARFFLFPDDRPGLDITREWARPPQEFSRRGHDVIENDTHPGDWYRYAHECKPLEENPMTQTTTKKASAAAKNLPLKAKQGGSKKGAAPTVTAASAETAAPGLVESATCPETGATYTVGEWVSYSIKGAAMTGQILTLEIQAPPFQPVASVPNSKTGLAWTLELRELQATQAPDDQPFPVTEAELDAALAQAAPGPTFSNVAALQAAPVSAAPDPDQPFPVSETQIEEALDAASAPEAAGEALTLTVGAPVNDGRRTLWVWKIEEDHVALRKQEDFKKRENQGGGTLWVPKSLLHEWKAGPVPETPAAEADMPAPELTLEELALSVTSQENPVGPGTLGLHSVPLAQLVRSNCNVRRHYDPAAIEELAASLRAEGQIENATGRWNADGQVEIVAGESRRRAQVLRETAGETGLTLLVNIRELTDAEALSISATENMRRRSMTGLEECEAMMRLQDAGRSVEDLAAMFGYKSLQPVADRVLVARNLHTTGRDALDSGELSLAKAFVIARAAGEDLQKAMLQEAHYRSAKDLSGHLTRGQFLVRLAGFNVEKSGLSVKRDLFDTFEPYFEDKARALDAQLAHARMLAERRTKKGEWAFVEVDPFKGWWSAHDHKRYDGTGGGLVITVNLETGELQERKNIKLRAAAPAAPSGSTPAPAPREMPDSAYLEAHILRAKAARASIVGNPHLTLALTVWGLVLGNSNDMGRIGIGQLSGLGAADLIPDEVKAAQNRLREALLPSVMKPEHGVFLADTSGRGERPSPQKLLELLVGMTDAELLGHLNTLTALVAYNWSSYNNKDAPGAEYVYLAGLTGAPERLAQDFTLTDEWLKRYPRHELVALAEEAGLGRALVEDAKTLKEMRARILEHAERLHAEGFVPRLVRFAEEGGQ